MTPTTRSSTGLCARPRLASPTHSSTGRTSARATRGGFSSATARRPAPSTTTCREPGQSCSAGSWRRRAPREHRSREQRVVIFGAGTAGVGIADFICSAMVREGIHATRQDAGSGVSGSHGLLVDGIAAGMRDFQRAYARALRRRCARGSVTESEIGLLEVVRAVQPTVLIGCAAQPSSFNEEVVREMAAHADRPIIFALSNPTSLSEAVPSDLIAWSDGRALVATGSPFPPVQHAGLTYTIGQANNALRLSGSWARHHRRQSAGGQRRHAARCGRHGCGVRGRIAAGGTRDADGGSGAGGLPTGRGRRGASSLGGGVGSR